MIPDASLLSAQHIRTGLFYVVYLFLFDITLEKGTHSQNY